MFHVIFIKKNCQLNIYAINHNDLGGFNYICQPSPQIQIFLWKMIRGIIFILKVFGCEASQASAIQEPFDVP